MTPYDGQLYQPPAPVALLSLRTLDDRNQTLADVPALLDTGADITCVPRWAVERLGLIPDVDDDIKLAWFDGSTRSAESVQLEASFQGGRFQGRYALIDQAHGIIGRNLLNHFQFLFNGPKKTWQRLSTG